MDTEEKILTAAIVIFSEKGYDATRIRNIAEKAEVNLALVNYHFHSKENLFRIVMRMKIKKLFGDIVPIICDETTALETKFELVSAQFAEAVSTEPGLPAFVFGELQKKDSKFIEILPVGQIGNSSIIRQIAERRPDLNPLQFIMNLLSIMYFPYAVAPVMAKAGLASEEDFAEMLKERQKFVPIWIKNMLRSDNESAQTSKDERKSITQWMKKIIVPD